MFPELNAWLDAVPDPRVQAMCTYSFRHVLWQASPPFCCEQASRNLHVLMQVASVLGQVLNRGILKRLTRACRKITDVKLVEMLRASLIYVLIPPGDPPRFQLRFCNSS